jgi:hypothetical protein
MIRWLEPLIPWWESTSLRRMTEVKYGETRACYQSRRLSQGQPVKADAENEGEQRAQREIAVRIAPEKDNRPLGGGNRHAPTLASRSSALSARTAQAGQQPLLGRRP